MQWGFQWYTWAMKPPIFIRPLTAEERLQWEADRRTADAFRVRRAQIVLASARRLSSQAYCPVGGRCRADRAQRHPCLACPGAGRRAAALEAV
jgi:hypothetical protein